MKTLIQTLFFFLLVTQICFAQWYQQNSGTTKNLHAVQFVDANNGWVVGDSGTIIHTTNGGTEWLHQTSGTTLPLNDVKIINEHNGWIVGGYWYWENIILYTTNGGVEWVQQTVGDSLRLNAIYFINDSIGWVVGWNWDGVIGYIPIILKTTDGGNAWISQSAPTGWPLNDVYFIDANIGFIAGGMEWGDGGDGVILKTTNGGDTWSEQIAQSFTCWYGISFSDAQNGIVIGTRRAALGSYGNIFRTTDGGTNWIFTIEDGSRLKGVTLINSTNVWVVGEGEYGTWGGTILFSGDKGINWTSQGAFPNSLNSVCLVNLSTGWAVSDNGTVLHTTNGGVTFAEEEQIDNLSTTYSLSNNFPNPFNPSTKIIYSVPKSSNVIIKVFDVLGNEIEALVNEGKPAGTYELTWYAEGLPSGVYFYKLQAGSFVETKKMILLK